MNKTAKWLMILLSATLLGAGAAAVINPYVYENHGSIETVGCTVTFLNGTDVTVLDWGAVENGTAYVWDEPLNITNISNVDANLIWTTKNWDNITDVTAEFLYLDDTPVVNGTVLAPNESIIVNSVQTVTASGDWSYTIIIEAKSVE